MKTIVGFKTYAAAVVALAALGATGCQTGWKISNPFAKAPKAAPSEAPSELDELDDLTPPPENYASSSDSNAKDRKTSDESLAQNGDYDAPKKAPSSVKIEPETTVDDSRNLLANAAAQSALAASENFKTPSYGQNYQSEPIAATNYQSPSNVDNYNVASTYSTAQAQPNYGAETAFPTPSAPSTQSSFAAAPASAYPPAPTDAAPQTNQIAAAPPAPYSVPSPAPASTVVDPNLNYSTINVADQTAVAQNQFPAAAPPVFPTVDATAFPAQTAQVARSFPDPVPAPAPSAPYQVAPTSAAPFPTADAFPVAASQTAPPQGAAPDAYSDVYYQRQTTSGGFAPGSVGIY